MNIRHRSIQFICLPAIILLTLLSGCAPRPIVPTPQPQPTRDPTEEKFFEDQLEAMNPAAVPVFREATSKLDAGQYPESQHLFQKVIDMAPGFSTAYRRLGYIESYANDNLDGAIVLLQKAVELEPSADNQSQLAILLFKKGTPRDNQEAVNLASSAIKLSPNDLSANLILMVAAASTNDIQTVRQADDRLLKIAPYNPLVHFYAGLLAATDKKWEKAEAELLTSQALGMNAEPVRKALDGGISRNAFVIRFLRWGGISMAGWLGGLGLLSLAGALLSRFTLRSLGRMEPASNARLRPSERYTRSIYRVIIFILSIYFYISIPFVILALILVVGGAFYLFFAIGTIPINLALILVVMLIASLFAILRSIFARSTTGSLGRMVRQQEAPELWKLTQQVAIKMATRPVDSIYLTPFSGIAVNEDGSILKKLRGGGRRNLLLGMGSLNALNQGQFASIIAHEYGHFSNRDTAGGNLAHKVFTSLSEMALGLAVSGARQFFNPVWLFVINYHKIYLRVTLGASRLQEILADRFAVIAYGKGNFVEGLKSIIRQTIAFNLHANFEVRKSFELHQPISNLYQLPMEAELQGELDEQFDQAMKAKTSPFDSHPSPMERFALVDRVQIPYALDQENGASVLDLFTNPESLQQEMTVELFKNVKIVKVS